MKNKNKTMMSIGGIIFTLLLVQTVSRTQSIVQTSNMIENPGSFVASINPDSFKIGIPIFDSICLEITIMTPPPGIYSIGDRLNYTLIDIQPHEYIFDQVIYAPNGTIYTEDIYTVSRSELRLPLFMTTTNKSLIQELFNDNLDWNYTYKEQLLFFSQKAYDYPELGDISYSEYRYNETSGWLVSLYQFRTASNQSILMEIGMNAVATALLPTTTVETTEPTSESSSLLSSIPHDSSTTTTTTTIPNITSFPGFLVMVSSIILIVIRKIPRKKYVKE